MADTTTPRAINLGIMPLHNEVPSLWKIASKKVANLLIDSVKYKTKGYGDYEKKVYELQKFMSYEFGAFVHDVCEQVEIQAQHHNLELASRRVLFAVVIHSDREVFNSMERYYLPLHINSFEEITFFKSHLEQCHCLVKLDVRGLHPDLVVKCNYFQEISNNCKDTLKNVSFPFSSCEEALPLLNNLKKCKKLISVNGCWDGDYWSDFTVSSQYAIGVKMFVESLPKLSTLSLPDLNVVLLKYDELDMVGFSSTSLTGFGKSTFFQNVPLLHKLFQLCPKIKQISLISHFTLPQYMDSSDQVLIKFLDSSAIHLQSLSVILTPFLMSDDLLLMKSIGPNLRTLTLIINLMTPFDFFVLGQVCNNLEILSVEVYAFVHLLRLNSVAHLIKGAASSGMFSKLKSLTITMDTLSCIFNPHVEMEVPVEVDILAILLSNTKQLEEIELQTTFNSALRVMIPFIHDRTLDSLKRFTYQESSRLLPTTEDRLTADTIRLILDMCPKLSFLKLMMKMTDDAKKYVKDYREQLLCKNLFLEMQVEE